MSGPVTVYEGDQPYSGDARMLDLQPNEERYLSYALDTGVEIKPFDVVRPGPEMTARMENGHLHVQYKLRHTRTYVIVNRSPEARKVVLEQPIRAGWKLVLPEKPAEMTTDLYRFDVDVKAGETVKYEVSEELPRIDPFAVTKQADWTGFATSLGLDVWTENKRTPEDSFLMQVVNPNTLQVTHKDRRSHDLLLQEPGRRGPDRLAGAQRPAGAAARRRRRAGREGGQPLPVQAGPEEGADAVALGHRRAAGGPAGGVRPADPGRVRFGQAGRGRRPGPAVRHRTRASRCGRRARLTRRPWSAAGSSRANCTRRPARSRR